MVEMKDIPEEIQKFITRKVFEFNKERIIHYYKIYFIDEIGNHTTDYYSKRIQTIKIYYSNGVRNDCIMILEPDYLYTTKVKKKLDFPEKTLQIMINTCRVSCNNSSNCLNEHLYDKLKEIETMTDINKKNRWFGYYQKVGECYELWTLEQIIELVRKERDEL